MSPGISVSRIPIPFRKAGINWSSYWSPLNFVIEGHSFAANDSLEAFANSTINYAYTATPATGGATMSILEGRAATTDALIRGGHRNIMMLWIGANDIQAEGDGAVFYAALKSYVQDRIAAGWTIFCFTTTPVNDARAVMFEVERDAANGLMRSDLALLDRVYILDTDTISELDDPSDQLYYSGEVHLSFLGHWLANNLFRSSLNTASSGAAVKAEEISDDFVLSPTGTGAGISRLDIWSDEYTVITLDGNAKFYSDSGATADECDTWAIGPSTTLPFTRFIKTTGGNSNLKIVRNRLSRISNWVSSTNAMSIAGDITQLAGIEQILVSGNNTLSGDVTGMTTLTSLDVTGSNTLSGSVAALTALTKISVTGSNTLTGSISALVSLTIINVTGSNTLSGSIAALADLEQLIIQGSNTVSGSIAGLVKLKFVSLRGSNTVTGSIEGLVDVTYLEIWGSNTVTGDITPIVPGCTRFYFNACHLDTYSGGATWSNALVIITPSAGYGYDQTELSTMLIDMNNSAGGPASKTISLTGASASMADTTQGGIWGDFDGETTPSALATAYKNLIRVKGNTVTLNGIVVPGVSGDGTGFPAGFGDWYRS